MAINFPNSPSLGQLYNYSGTTWQWSGEYWNVYSAQTGYITSVSNSGNGYPVIDGVTSNALTLKSFSGTNVTITDSGGQLNFYVPLNGGGGGQLYYFNISKTQTPYLELATSATTGAEQSITSAATSGNTVTLGQFLTLSGYPGVSIIPGGVWSFYLHSYKQNSSASFDIYCDVYKRTTGGTETLLFSTDPSPVLSNSPTPIMVLTDTYYSGTTLDTSDRILVNVRATNTSNNTYSITFVSEGSQHYSYVSSPLLLRTTDIYVDSFTYTPSANTITIGQTESYPPQSIQINSFSGLTVGSISATTYQNLPSQSGSGISAFSYSPTTGVLTITKNDTNTLTAGTFTYVSATTLSSANVLSVTSNGGSPQTSTVNAVTGGTYSNGVIILSGTGSISTSITGLTTPFTGGTVSGPTNFTNGLTANTISATTYSNLPNTIYTGNGSLTSNRTVSQPNFNLTFSGTSSSSLIVLENFKQGDTTNIVPGILSFAQGSYTNASGDYSHAEGNSSTTTGIYSHAEGSVTTSIGEASHSEGRITVAQGNYSHSEGIGRYDDGTFVEPSLGLSYLEFTIPNTLTFSSNTITSVGSSTITVSGDQTYIPTPSSLVNLKFNNITVNFCVYPALELSSLSYDGGADETTFTFSSTLEALYGGITGCTNLSNGIGSHSEGLSTRANGKFSHSEGIGTYADGEGQHVSGRYNLTGNTGSLFVIGNGSDDYNRSDIFNVNQTGALLFGDFNATTISATTYQNLPTYVSAVTESANVFTVTTNTGNTTLTVDAVTGGTYNSATGIITLSGTGNVNGNQITGFGTGGSFTGGTVNGATNFTAGLTANTFSATTITAGGQLNGLTISSTQSSGDEGGQLDLSVPQTNTSISGSTVSIDLYQNRLRFFESGGSFRGAYIDLTSASAGVGSNLLSGGPGGGMTWNSANTTQSMTADNGYVTTAATLTTFTLPSTIDFGKTVEIAGNSSGLWQLNQNSGQQVRFGNQTTTTSSGILSATSQGDCIKLICVNANTSFIVTSSIGNIFFN